MTLCKAEVKINQTFGPSPKDFLNTWHGLNYAPGKEAKKETHESLKEKPGAFHKIYTYSRETKNLQKHTHIYAR